MNQPLVSVAMVTCNVDRFLPEAIESILNQTFKDFEFVIVDYGSTDASKAIISRFASGDNRVKFHNIANCGLGEARNASCALAQGQYIAIMDADDVSVPQRLMWQLEFIERHPEVGVVGGAVEWIDSFGKTVAIMENPIQDWEIRSAALSRCPLWQPTVLMRRDVFHAVGGYRPAFAPAEDYDLWLRMAEHTQLANLKEVLLKYRIHPYQLSIRKQRQQSQGILAAQVSAHVRKNGGLDPLNKVQEITPETLVALGVPRSKQHKAFLSDYLQWVQHMYIAGEYATALTAAHEILLSDQDLEKLHISNLHLTIAEIFWRQRRFLSSIIEASRAVVARPVLLGRPLKRGLRRSLAHHQ